MRSKSGLLSFSKNARASLLMSWRLILRHGQNIFASARLSQGNPRFQANGDGWKHVGPRWEHRRPNAHVERISFVVHAGKFMGNAASIAGALWITSVRFHK